jgi:hypothetical protein
VAAVIALVVAGGQGGTATSSDPRLP